MCSSVSVASGVAVVSTKVIMVSAAVRVVSALASIFVMITSMLWVLSSILTFTVTSAMVTASRVLILLRRFISQSEPTLRLGAIFCRWFCGKATCRIALLFLVLRVLLRLLNLLRHAHLRWRHLHRRWHHILYWNLWLSQLLLKVALLLKFKQELLVILVFVKVMLFASCMLLPSERRRVFECNATILAVEVRH